MDSWFFLSFSPLRFGDAEFAKIYASLSRKNRREYESPIRVQETQLAVHPLAQRNAFL
jgi:hypothetical protein